MPVDVVSFWLKPFGFFDRNPALDVTPGLRPRPTAVHTGVDTRQDVIGPLLGCLCAPTRRRSNGPTDLTAEWLTAALGRRPVDGVHVSNASAPGQMSECYRVALSYAARRRRAGLGGAEGRRDRPQQPPDRPRAGPLRTRGAVLHRHRARPWMRRARRAVLPRRLSTPRPVRSTCCSAMPPPPWWATRSAAPQPNRPLLALTELGRVHGPLLGDAGAGPGGLAQPRGAAQPGADRRPVCGLRRPLRRPDRARAARRCASASSTVSTPTWQPKERPSAPQGLVHGDYRLDNMLFGEPGADRP